MGEISAAMTDFPTSDGLDTPGFFSAAMNNADENVNYFDTHFNNGNTSNAGNIANQDVDPRLVDASYPAGQPDVNFPPAMEDPTFSPFFGFSPRSSPAPGDMKAAARHQAFANPGGWSDMMPSNSSTMAPPPMLPSQEPSPPDSTDSRSNKWSAKQTRLDKTGGKRVQTRHGQITPPSDNSPTSPVSKDLPAQASSQFESLDSSTQSHEESLPPRKRGRKANATDVSEASPPRRQRKGNAGRPKGGVEKALSGENDKRQRFLERNRVAASKCRMKKKEWTGNLEGRARELQHEKAQLSMMVGSLRDEVLFLKGELLKHTNCGCDRIRQYLDQEVTNLASGPGGALAHVTGPKPNLQRPATEFRRSSFDAQAAPGERSIDSHRGSVYMSSLSGSPVSARGQGGSPTPIKMEDERTQQPPPSLAL
ncbi:MAG: hypothetical protein M4579_001410 [Chaenotheca gracillima]|nr:MAG: hypothetical protein M4579_001410 [Chaenotheca gracillima]